MCPYLDVDVASGYRTVQGWAAYIRAICRIHVNLSSFRSQFRSFSIFFMLQTFGLECSATMKSHVGWYFCFRVYQTYSTWWFPHIWSTSWPRAPEDSCYRLWLKLWIMRLSLSSVNDRTKPWYVEHVCRILLICFSIHVRRFKIQIPIFSLSSQSLQSTPLITDKTTMIHLVYFHDRLRILAILANLLWQQQYQRFLGASISPLSQGYYVHLL